MACFIILVQSEHARELAGGLVKTNCCVSPSELLTAGNGWGPELCGLTSSLGNNAFAPLDETDTVRTTGLQE